MKEGEIRGDIFSPKFSVTKNLWLRDFPCWSLTHIDMLTALPHTHEGYTASCGKMFHLVACFMTLKDFWPFLFFFFGHLQVSLGTSQFWTEKGVPMSLSLCHSLGGPFVF